MARAAVFAFGCAAATVAASGNAADDTLANTNLSSAKPLAEPSEKSPDDGREKRWNFHVQNTDIFQGDPAFPAKYSGPNSLNQHGEIQETVSLDLFGGVRLWHGAEVHLDELMWQGFGLSKTLGVEAFPSGEAFRLGTDHPKAIIARLFLRQTFGFGGDQETIEDDPLHLPGRQDASRLTLTLGKISVKDIFDNNAYANDPRTQFMSWGLMANEAWDYPADSLGYMTGFAAELNQPHWAVRYGFFQMPPVSNGMGTDAHYLDAWGMVAEFERRYTLTEHPGTIRLLAFLNSAHMGSYQEAIDHANPNADIVATRAYRYKYGFGLNVEQKIIKNVGAFARLGWSDGQNEAWVFSDVDRTATMGISVKGEFWGRPNDTFGLAGALSGISAVHQAFLDARGTGILAGDGALNYGWERVLETYYDLQVWKTVRFALDYQFVTNPAFNRDRGPVSIFGARLHWEF